MRSSRPDRLGEIRTRRGLFREGRLLETLSHPNIVRAYETLARPQPTVILETLTGATVAYLIEVEHERRGLPVADVAELGLQLCSAVGYLHRQRLLHLDLKPSNVVAELGHAKLIDLSVARAPGRDGRARPVAALRRLPQGLARAIDACLEREPRLRPGVPELAAALRAFA